ncbi:MAG: rhomboid family intramembrane serine protease [Bacteroidetes bacterium]|nr:rhomboid family intramembrane serine protease [Bacteroidota bacterium]
MSYNQGSYYRPSSFGGFRFFPPVVKILLIINTAVFIITGVFGYFHIGQVSLRGIINMIFGLMPLGQGFYPWQLITYQFLHADIIHILFNMVFGLWMFGKEVEQVWGSKKFLFYYLFCGVMAGIAQLLLAPIFEPALGPTIGASGAIYGVLIAFAVMYPDQYVYVYFLIPVKVKYFVMALIVIGVMSIGGESNIANLAHLGGALAGYLYILYDRYRVTSGRRSPRIFRRHSANSQWESTDNTDNSLVDAKVYDISESKSFEQKNEQAIPQKRIDEILDKISRSGYQSLSDEEKKILFEASKRMN